MAALYGICCLGDLGLPTAEQLAALRVAYLDACNRLVPMVREHWVWNRVTLQLNFAAMPSCRCARRTKPRKRLGESPGQAGA